MGIGSDCKSMITFFTTGKPFTGHNAVCQRNALASWKRVAPDAEVILFGNEQGAAETARELGIRHVEEVEKFAQHHSAVLSGDEKPTYLIATAVR
jgi:hypothetical protein